MCTEEIMLVISISQTVKYTVYTCMEEGRRRSRGKQMENKSGREAKKEKKKSFGTFVIMAIMMIAIIIVFCSCSQCVCYNFSHYNYNHYHHDARRAGQKCVSSKNRIFCMIHYVSGRAKGALPCGRDNECSFPNRGVRVPVFAAVLLFCVCVCFLFLWFYILFSRNLQFIYRHYCRYHSHQLLHYSQ